MGPYRLLLLWKSWTCIRWVSPTTQTSVHSKQLHEQDQSNKSCCIQTLRKSPNYSENGNRNRQTRDKDRDEQKHTNIQSQYDHHQARGFLTKLKSFSIQYIVTSNSFTWLHSETNDRFIWDRNFFKHISLYINGEILLRRWGYFRSSAGPFSTLNWNNKYNLPSRLGI